MIKLILFLKTALIALPAMEYDIIRRSPLVLHLGIAFWAFHTL